MLPLPRCWQQTVGMQATRPISVRGLMPFDATHPSSWPAAEDGSEFHPSTGWIQPSVSHQYLEQTVKTCKETYMHTACNYNKLSLQATDKIHTAHCAHN